ncbi:MAG: hypothetical protein JG768_745 [Fusobacteriales bacterium]|jgi:hypothetical protein|nr:hypothetical protein [Fusobacteriales bacterium]
MRKIKLLIVIFSILKLNIYSEIWNPYSRYGYMQLRHPAGNIKRGPSPYQLGASGKGYNVYLGTEYKGYRAGILYENLYDKEYKAHDIRTGILVQFADSKVTKALGSVRFDYTRTPEGFGITIPILHGNIGNIRKTIPKNSTLAGEIYAYRTITYWQNGQGRNFYEHRIDYWGDVESKDLIVVIEEKPWYLKIESLVSPHTTLKTKDDIIAWERDRQGPAELRQEVIYKFYRRNK